MTPPLRDLKGSRRDLAIAFGDGWKTAHEAAARVGRPTGSIFGVLRRMHADGLLISDADPDPPTRGTQYRLSASGMEALESVLSESSATGCVAPGQRILMVERKKDRVIATKVFSGSASAGVIDWAAEFATGWLLILQPDIDPYRLQGLVVAFENAGCRCREAVVDDVLPGPLLRDRSANLTKGVET